MVIVIVLIEGLLNFGMQEGTNFTFNQIVD